MSFRETTLTNDRPHSSRGRVPSAYDRQYNTSIILGGPAEAESHRPMRRVINPADASPREPRAGGKRVSQAPGGKESGFRLGSDKASFRTKATLNYKSYSPRDPDVAGGRPSSLGATKRPLVKPLQSIGGRASVSLGSDSTTYSESLKEYDLKSARREEVMAAAARAGIAGQPLELLRMERHHVRNVKPSGGKDHISLGDDRGPYPHSSALSSELSKATQSAYREKAQAMRSAGTSPRKHQGLRVGQPPGGKQTFDFRSYESGESTSRPLSPAERRRDMSKPRQPVGGRHTVAPESGPPAGRSCSPRPTQSPRSPRTTAAMTASRIVFG